MKKSIFGILLGCLALPAHANMIVYDPIAVSRLIQQVEEMKRQYDMLSKTYHTAEQQLDAAKQLQKLNQGHYQYGHFNNSLEHLKARQWSPNTWNDALHNIAGGNPTRYQALVKSYEEHHRMPSEAVFTKGVGSANFARYQQNRAVNEAVSVQTTYAFDDINQHLQSVHDLSQQIEKTENTKAALDLNGRLLAEMAYIQIQTLKIQTLISQQNAQWGASELDETAEWARFHALPEK